jgi:preprotein translocase subunit SecG
LLPRKWVVADIGTGTGVLAAVFFMTSLGLAYLANAKPTVSGSVIDAGVQTAPAVAPAEPPPPAKDGSKAQDIPK